jgi:hypothetical protein
MAPQKEDPAQGAAAGLPRMSLLGRGDTQDRAPKSSSTQDISRNPRPVQAAIADLTLECAVEAAHVASVAARHFVENAELGDLWAAEHSLGLAVRHLQEAARAFREWQRLKASAKEASR